MKTKFLLYLSLFVAIAANKWVASCLIPKSMVMKRKSILINLTTIILLLIGVNVSATNYTLSSSSITISTPGSHTLSGSGSGAVYITNSTVDAVYNITLNDINLVSATWGSAINVQNTSTGTMTVNFIVIGTNVTNAYNHGGIQSTGGTIKVVFTTTSSGTLTSTARYAGYYAFNNANSSTLTPSIASGITCTATLGGTSMAVASALSGAFTSRPLYSH